MRVQADKAVELRLNGADWAFGNRCAHLGGG